MSSPNGSPGGDGGKQRGRSPAPRGDRNRDATGAVVVPFSVALAAAGWLKLCLRGGSPRDNSTDHVQFAEGQPSDIIRVGVGDYLLEETGETVRIEMHRHVLSGNLNYTRAQKYDNAVELAKAH